MAEILENHDDTIKQIKPNDIFADNTDHVATI